MEISIKNIKDLKLEDLNGETFLYSKDKPSEIVTEIYKLGMTDEFLPPIIFYERS